MTTAAQGVQIQVDANVVAQTLKNRIGEIEGDKAFLNAALEQTMAQLTQVTSELEQAKAQIAELTATPDGKSRDSAAT